jgi:hypothetical protein
VWIPTSTIELFKKTSPERQDPIPSVQDSAPWLPFAHDDSDGPERTDRGLKRRTNIERTMGSRTNLLFRRTPAVEDEDMVREGREGGGRRERRGRERSKTGRGGDN